MNYYNIPTKYMDIDFQLQVGETKKHSLSDSFIRNIESLYGQVNKFLEYYTTILDKNVTDSLYKINNTYSFLHDIVSNEVKSYVNLECDIDKKNIFFIVHELINSFEFIYTGIVEPSNIVYIGDNVDMFQNSIQYINNRPPGLITIDNNDINDVFNKIEFTNKDVYNKYKGFQFFDTPETYHNDKNINEYIVYLLKTIGISITTAQPCIIKLWDITYLPVIEFVYMLSNIYNIVYITKPTITQHTHERYLVCKDINNMHYNIDIRKKLYNRITNIVTTIEQKIKNEVSGGISQTIITSVLKNKISYHFLNKVEESTLIIGQKNIEHNENIIILLKMYGKDEKIENIKKNSIIKCYQWCSKNNIPTISL
jgi:hypothetical protein